MQKKSWFGGFIDKIKGAFTSQTSYENQQQQLQLPEKQYTQDQQLFIEQMFNKFSKEMRNVHNLNTDQQLSLYGLYKQGTLGDCNIPEPSFYEQEAKYKFKAWNKMKGLTKTQAQEIYIQAAYQFNPSLGKGGDSNLEKKGGQVFSNSVPRPKVEQEQEYDHPYFEKMLNNEDIQVDKKLLLQMNSEPNVLPLHFAIDNEKVKYVQLFLKHLDKEQVNMPDGEGMTSLEYAELIGNQEILKLIQQAIL